MSKTFVTVEAESRNLSEPKMNIRRATAGCTGMRNLLHIAAISQGFGNPHKNDLLDADNR